MSESREVVNDNAGIAIRTAHVLEPKPFAWAVRNAAAKGAWYLTFDLPDSDCYWFVVQPLYTTGEPVACRAEPGAPALVRERNV